MSCCQRNEADSVSLISCPCKVEVTKFSSESVVCFALNCLSHLCTMVFSVELVTGASPNLFSRFGIRVRCRRGSLLFSSDVAYDSVSVRTEIIVLSIRL